MGAMAVGLVAMILLALVALWLARQQNWSEARLAMRVAENLQHHLFEPEHDVVQPAERVKPRKQLRRSAKKRGRTLTQLQKKVVAARDAWRCQICHNLVDSSYEVDHIKPFSEGGSDHPSNLRLLCRACHGRVTIRQRLADQAWGARV